jgi:hypothetical protein
MPLNALELLQATILQQQTELAALRAQIAAPPASRPANKKLEQAQAELLSRMKPEPKAAPAPPIVDTFGEKHFLVAELAAQLGYHRNTIIREADRFFAKHGWGVRYTGTKQKKRTISASAARLFFLPSSS